MQAQLIYTTLASANSPLALDLVAMLALAAVVATIFARFKLEVIPGYLIAGMLLGPGVLNVVKDPENIESISGLAIVLLMFGIGLHLDLSTIRRGMVPILLVGAVSTLAFTGIAFGILTAAGMAAPIAMLIAMATSMSSTAVLVRILFHRREVRAAHGRVGLGIAIVQDLWAVIVLALVPPLADWAGVQIPGAAQQSSWFDELPAWLEFITRGLIGVGGIVVMFTAGKFLLPRILLRVAKVGSGELMLVLSGAIAIGAGLATGVLGFSPEMGAFLAGFLLAATPFRHQLSGQLAPMRDILMAIFFTAVGLQLRPAEVVADWWIVLLCVAGVMGFKLFLIGGSSWAAGMTAPMAGLTAFYLANSGEFTLVVLGAAEPTGMLSDRLLSDTIAVVVISLIISPLLVGPAHQWCEKLRALPLAPWIRSAALRDPAPGEKSDAHTPRRHVIVAGFGPVGRALADRLAVNQVPVTVIELNPQTVQRQSGLGRPIVYGDVTNPDVLESAGIHEADAIVLTIPDDDATLRACRTIRGLVPDIFIAARTNYLSGSFKAQQMGADHVTVEEVVTAQAMEREVMTKLEQHRVRRAEHKNSNGSH